MNNVSMTGGDSLLINDTLIDDLADGDAFDLTFPDDLATVTIGKDGNAIFSKNESGSRAEAVMRVLRGSPKDKYLNNLLTLQNQNFAGMTLLNGEFIKKVGNGQGQITADTYILQGGVFTKMVPGKTNSTGEAEQSISIYTMQFAKAGRAIG